ncbi:MAG: phage baseplate assembly protein [Betaproteobacteria bacterium]|nr:phage baseplate assembly protein [Betaproteobacteria bacterium]
MMMSNQVWRRLQLLVARGVAMLVGDSKVQARVLADEVLPNIDRVEPYGFSYYPKAGAQTYLLFPSGDRSHGIAIVIGDKQYNMALKEGEVALHDDEGNYVHIQRDGNIEINAATKITLKAPEIVLDGQVWATQSATVNQGLSVLGQEGTASAITGNFQIVGTITCNGKDISDTHTHTGVQPGGGSTGTVE